MTEPSKQSSWGIIRYAPGSGAVASEDDAAAFDGWYKDRADALAIAQRLGHSISAPGLSAWCLLI
jgi:hypothetical protein